MQEDKTDSSNSAHHVSRLVIAVYTNLYQRPFMRYPIN